MARKRTNIDVSLFPFLSVLCSVIGVLLLFIVMILSTRAIAEEERYSVENAAPKPVAGKPDVFEDGIDQKSFQEIQAEVERLTRLLEQRQQQRNELVHKMDILEDLIELKKTELILPASKKRPQEFDKPIPIAIVPEQGFKVDLRPIFIEVSDQEYVVQPSKMKFPPIKTDERDNSVPSPELRQFLADLNPREEYLVFLIRPNGIPNFELLENYVSTKHENLRLGWEPMLRDESFTNSIDN